MNTKKYTVITGASSGIGYAAAIAFSGRNKNMILTARRKKNLELLKDNILRTHPALDIIIKPSDLSQTSNIYQFYEDTKKYQIETWINNAGLGNYDSVANQNLKKIETMLHVNIEALTLFSSLFVQKYKDIEQTQLINISSCGGYMIVPNAITYCAAKFFVSAFTEGLARELQSSNAKMQVKVLAPAATKTEFGKLANNVSEYSYDNAFATYHTSQKIAEFLLQLYDSHKVVGIVHRETFAFNLCDPLFDYAGNSVCNQKLTQDTIQKDTRIIKCP